MLGRRFLILVAVLMGLTALAASFAPRQPATREDRETASPSPAPAGSPTVVTVHESVNADESGSVVTVREGDLVELIVEGKDRGSVSVLDRIDAIDPTTPARFSFVAGEPDEHPIVFLEDNREIGTLVIR